jgi:hypothetical protein
MTTEKLTFPARFSDKRNISFAGARVIWADAEPARAGSAHRPPREALPAGWVLPGGARTDNFDRAFAAAVNISRFN